jgi:hypothetical protein
MIMEQVLRKTSLLIQNVRKLLIYADRHFPYLFINSSPEADRAENRVAKHLPTIHH